MNGSPKETQDNFSNGKLQQSSPNKHQVSDRALSYMKAGYAIHEKYNPAFKGDYSDLKNVNSLACFMVNFANHSCQRSPDIARRVYETSKKLAWVAGNRRVY